MQKNKPKFLVIFSLLLIVKSITAQTYQFKDFGPDQGLSHPFVYTINEDPNGYIWVGTGEGLCKFNGLEFLVSEQDDTLANGFVTTSYLDNKGKLWFGHNSGHITYLEKGKINFLNASKDIKSSIISITGDDDGNVFIASQNNGLIKINKSLNTDTFKSVFSNNIIYSLLLVNSNTFLIGTDKGLALYSIENNQISKKYNIKELEYIAVQNISKGIKDNTFWIGTEDSGFYLLKGSNEIFDTYEILNIGEQHKLAYENVQSVLEDKNRVLWIGTFGKGMYKLNPVKDRDFQYQDIIHYSTDNGLSNNFVKCIFQDWQGNNWLGTYGNGLALLADEALTLHYENLEGIEGNILSVAESETNLWLGGDNSIIKIDKNTNKYTLINKSNGLPNDKFVALYLDNKQDLWVGTDNSGVYKINTTTNKAVNFYQSDNTIGNKINSITGLDNKIWVATQNGVLVFNTITGESELYNTSDGLPHNDIKQVFIDSQNHKWIATKSNGILALDTNYQYTIAGNVNLEFTAIAEDYEGNIWATTYGDGVFKFEQDSIKYYSTDNGLKSNYCYSIIADGTGCVWIGHRLGFSRINVKTGNVKTYGKEEGILGDCNSNAVLNRNTGRILIGTTKGLVVYDKSKEKKNKQAPRLNISEILFSGVPVDISKPVQLPYDIYKLNINYVGLNFSNPEAVRYQYKLEGYDLEWSEFTINRGVYYPRIEDGSYTFMLKACTADGHCVEKPLEIKMSIKPPIWKTWWFITISILLGVGIIYGYIKNREKKQKALQEYLERELQARTKEVIKQKEMLEVKNRDITDSINYAQRIQKSILPSVATINKSFSGSFVYYQPRDIVSGDFYWYDKVNENKFLIVCADSTGHGVPGAFMSMIGTTLIKDICLRDNVDSPSEVLQILDKELQSTLNQNIDAERAHDGMDIIVCEIDVSTYYMRFASAMRPLILYKDNKLQYVRGTKASIGGDPKAEKRFENIGFQLHKGDIIYMFSDGYPDQFGGPRGKKFKMDRVKNMLADVCEQSMEEQQKYVDKTFNEWRGKLQQVDDVLFMGVRI